MARSVDWSEKAWNDLESAADYIATDSPRYASSFVREVRDAARSLESMAERGRVVPEFQDPSIRELLVRNHRLIYSLSLTAVHIVGFIHGSRDLWALWEREGRTTT